ncbi:MAG: hypothetical protein WBZ36_14650 [Candidatus Nitrosopolaris sp.]
MERNAFNSYRLPVLKNLVERVDAYEFLDEKTKDGSYSIEYIGSPTNFYDRLPTVLETIDSFQISNTNTTMTR